MDITKHVKVWISFAKFETDLTKAREVYTRAYNHFKEIEPHLKEERLMLLENWLQIETEPEMAKMVKEKLPKKVKKRQETEEGWEEYYDYIFPDDAGQARNLKILDMAHQWKKE